MYDGPSSATRRRRNCLCVRSITDEGISQAPQARYIF